MCVMDLCCAEADQRTWLCHRFTKSPDQQRAFALTQLVVGSRSKEDGLRSDRHIDRGEPDQPQHCSQSVVGAP